MKPLSLFAQARCHGGPIYAVLAYGSWGLLPMYWKFLGPVPAVEVLCHRILWSLLFLLGILSLQGRQREIRGLWQSPRRLAVLLATGALLALNWGIYIYGVNTDQVVETSLGYFINPLVNVLLGGLFLRERLYRGQQLAVGLAAVGVGYFIWQLGVMPWIAMGLALSFACYGLLRKLVGVTPLLGLAVETMLIAPVAIAWIFHWTRLGHSHLGQTPEVSLLLIGAGLVTSMPLIWFNHAAQRLPLSTLGFFQYVAPSLQLLLGVALYREPFTPTHAITFACIWTALALYTTTTLRQRADAKAAQPTAGIKS